MGILNLYFKARDTSLKKWLLKKYYKAEQRYKNKKELNKNIINLEKKLKKPVPVNYMQRALRYKNNTSKVAQKYYEGIRAELNYLKKYKNQK